MRFSTDDESIRNDLLEECGYLKVLFGAHRLPASNFVYRWYWFISALIHSIYIWLRPRPFHSRSRYKRESDSCVLYIYFTKNQFKALNSWVKWGQAHQSASFYDGADWRISWNDCGRLSLRYLVSTYLILAKAKDSESLIPCLTEFIRYRAGKQLAERLLTEVRPAYLVVSNDHSGIFRAFLKVARERGIKTIYTQHAAVGRNFPPLRFDLTMLDGMQSITQYAESGVLSGTIVITGRSVLNMKADTGEVSSRTAIGIATNGDDRISDWIQVIRDLRKHSDNIILRCHPAENRKPIWKMICHFYRVQYDRTSLDAFLTKCKILVTGASGIALDAALNGVPTLCYPPQKFRLDRFQDYYRYSHYKLCLAVNEIADISNDVKMLPSPDFSGVSAFDAGVADDPVKSKWNLMTWFTRDAGTANESPQLKCPPGFVSNEYAGQVFYCTPNYSKIIIKNEWI